MVVAAIRKARVAAEVIRLRVNDIVLFLVFE
jgi:hypothetical protein